MINPSKIFSEVKNLFKPLRKQINEFVANPDVKIHDIPSWEYIKNLRPICSECKGWNPYWTPYITEPQLMLCNTCKEYREKIYELAPSMLEAQDLEVEISKWHHENEKKKLKELDMDGCYSWEDYEKDK